MKYLAVLITVFNRKATTLSCLERLFAQEIPDGVEMHVYLTNDGCTDGTPEAVKERFPQVHIIDGDGTLYWNRGMWTAWNVASHTNPETLKPLEPLEPLEPLKPLNPLEPLKPLNPLDPLKPLEPLDPLKPFEPLDPSETTYSWYFWLNDDTALLPGAITELITESEKCGQEPNIIVGATKASDSDSLTYGGRINDIIQPCDGKSCCIDKFNGNIVLVSKKAFDVLGNLDYYFTHSRGDYDYGVRAKKAGITMLQCGTVLGICDKHEHIDKWCDPKVPFRQRWKLMHKPNGMPAKEIFHLEHRQFGIVTASFHFCTIYLRCIFPKLWKN